MSGSTRYRDLESHEYQLVGQEHREYADDLLREIRRADGMSAFRTKYVHRTLHWFGGKAAARRTRVPPVTLTSP